jgi:hypothetical protein
LAAVAVAATVIVKQQAAMVELVVEAMAVSAITAMALPEPLILAVVVAAVLVVGVKEAMASVPLAVAV